MQGWMGRAVPLNKTLFNSFPCAVTSEFLSAVETQLLALQFPAATGQDFCSKELPFFLFSGAKD